MEINEQLACSDTLSTKRLKNLRETNIKRIATVNSRVAEAFDTNELEAAKQALAELKFYKNVAEKIKEIQ